MKFQLINKNDFNFYMIVSFIPFLGCFSLLKPPPITFTQSQTAAERQMIGENKEIESDGWLLSSIKTSAIGPVEWKKDKSEELKSPEQTEEFKILNKIILHTTPEIKKLKNLKYIGENLQGYLSIIEDKREITFDKIYPNQNDKKRIKELIALVNETRNKLFNLLKDSKNIVSTKEFLKTVEYGEYYEEKKGVWILKE
jgi:hypothetical protein